MRRIIGNDERAFKGVFIPAELWLNEDLSPMELLLMTEIDSLDKKNGCYASNKHFAEFFGLTASRISQMINSLAERGYLELHYNKQGKQIVNRLIKVVRKSSTPIKNTKGGYLENDEAPIENAKGGYLENAKESNTTRVIHTSNTNRVSVSKLVSNAREPKKSSCKSIDLWEKNWGRPNSVLKKRLAKQIDEFGDDLVAWTIANALKSNVSSKKADSWLNKAFDSYRRDKVTTVQQAKQQADDFHHRVSQKSKHRRWYDKGGHVRVEQLPDWAKDNHPRKDAKASQDQLDESARLMAQLHQKQGKEDDKNAMDNAL